MHTHAGAAPPGALGPRSLGSSTGTKREANSVIMKRILVCLDASPRAPIVLEAAADLARRTNARLCLFRSVGLPPEIDQEYYVHSPTNLIDTMLAKAKVELATLARNMP